MGFVHGYRPDGEKRKAFEKVRMGEALRGDV
jgi:hypothetical protein